LLKITLEVKTYFEVKLLQKVTKTAFEMKTVLKLGRKKRVKIVSRTSFSE